MILDNMSPEAGTITGHSQDIGGALGLLEGCRLTLICSSYKALIRRLFVQFKYSSVEKG